MLERSRPSGRRYADGVELPREVAVAGAGTMGAGIAAIFARAGCRVRLTARRETSLEAARGRLGGAGVLLTTSLDVAVEGADLVVETIAEAVEPKVALLARAEELAAPGAILTTNTSSLRLADLAEGLRRPGRFAGLHWFNPPELVELVEVVGGARTEPAVLEALRAWMELLGKAPVVVARDVPGFVGNRLQYALMREAYALVDAGVCSREDVDRAVTHGLGARWAAIGPFEAADLAGLGVHAAVAGNLWPELDAGREPPASLAELVRSGALGVDGGRGLRGAYPPEAGDALKARRDRVLRGMPALRDGAGQEATHSTGKESG
jgi:3-hydroxybutyryl-CoA dehydrogenase